MLFGHTNGLYLDDERFLPFWERLQALDVPVYLHAADAETVPSNLAGRPELIGPVWSWTAETATHALRLVFSEVFTRFPRVRVILGHMGETLPYLLWRLDARARVFADQRSDAPSEIIRRHFMTTTSGMFSDEPMFCALSAIGEDNILFAVDHPFESMDDASAWFDRMPLCDSTREKIAFANARRILRL